MSQTKLTNNTDNQHHTNNTETLKQHPITFQRLAGKWYAFSEVNGELYFADIPENLILDDMQPIEEVMDNAA